MKHPTTDGVDCALDVQVASRPSVRSVRPTPERIHTPLRIEILIAENADFVFRCLRRAGLDVATAEDGAQQVFIVAAQKLENIEEGKEKAFLYATAKNIAARQHRSFSRRSEVELADDGAEDVLPGDGPSLDEMLDQRRARILLDELLEAMPEKLADVFVLSEIEELSAPEVAEILSIPQGTVASRLLRAREVFDQAIARVQSRRAFRAAPGGPS